MRTRCEQHATAPARTALDCWGCWCERIAVSLRAPGAAALREELSVESEDVAAERAGYLYGPFGLEDGIETLEDAGRTARASWSGWRRELAAMPRAAPVVRRERGWRGSAVAPVVPASPRAHERYGSGDLWNASDFARDWCHDPQRALGWLLVRDLAYEETQEGRADARRRAHELTALWGECEYVPQTARVLPLVDPQPG